MGAGVGREAYVTCRGYSCGVGFPATCCLELCLCTAAVATFGSEINGREVAIFGVSYERTDICGQMKT